MRSYTHFTPFIIGALFTTLTACEVGRLGDPDDGPDAIRVESQNPNDPLDTANSVYFRARPADREGFLVRRVNRVVTTCADGTVQPECYVTDIDTAQLQLDAQGTAELRGHVDNFLLRGIITGNASTLGVFRASEAWQGHAGQVATGPYVRVTSSGIVCITYPCMSYTAARLNSDQASWNIAAVNFDGIGKDDAEDAQAQLKLPQGVMASVEMTTVSGPAGTAPALTATEYYLPFATRELPRHATGLAH